MTKETLTEILAKHKAWMNNEEGGERANLSDANLRNADLSYANLGFNVFFGGSYGAPVYQACRGFGSRDAVLTLLAIGKQKDWKFFTGCFSWTRKELEIAIKEKHGESTSAKCYLRAIKYLVKTAKDNLPENHE